MRGVAVFGMTCGLSSNQNLHERRQPAIQCSEADRRNVPGRQRARLAQGNCRRQLLILFLSDVRSRKRATDWPATSVSTMTEAKALMAIARAQKAMLILTKQALQRDQTEGLRAAAETKEHADVY